MLPAGKDKRHVSLRMGRSRNFFSQIGIRRSQQPKRDVMAKQKFRLIEAIHQYCNHNLFIFHR